MIIERIPAISSLSEDEKYTLVHELLSELSERDGGQPDSDIVALLEKRYEEYQSNPDAILTWDEVKARVLRN